MFPDNQKPDSHKIPAREALVVAIVSVVVTGLLFYLKYPPRLPYADEFEYLGYAFGIHKFGVFGQVSSDTTLAPGASMFFPPLYPHFLAALMAADQTFAATTSCVLINIGGGADGAITTSGCDPRYGLAIPVQVLIAGLVPFFIWATARRLSGSTSIAVIAALLALAARSYVYYANHFLTEALTLPLAAALGWAMVAAWQDRTSRAVVVSAVCFGLLVLTRAGWSYAALVIIPIFLWMGVMSWRACGARAFLPAIFFVMATTAILSPWIIRNAVLFDTPALTGGYGAKALMHRLPYNRMTNDEWKAAFVYWLPDFGDSLAARIFPKEQYQRLDFGYPNGFYTSERLAFAAEVEVKRGGQDIFDYLIEQEIMGNLGKHIMVTLAMVWRGMFAAKYLGLIGWIFFLPLFIFALHRRWAALIVLALPPLFMLGLNAFVSVSIPRYNLPLIPVLAFSIAYVMVNAVSRLRRKYDRVRAP